MVPVAKTPKTVQVNLRLPRALHERARRAAFHERISLNAYLVRAVERAQKGAAK